MKNRAAHVFRVVCGLWMFVLSTTTYAQTDERCELIPIEAWRNQATWFNQMRWVNDETIWFDVFELRDENYWTDRTAYDIISRQLMTLGTNRISLIDTYVPINDLARFARSIASEHRAYSHFAAAPSEARFIYAQDMGENVILIYVDTTASKQIDLGIEIDADLLPVNVLWSSDEQTFVIGTASGLFMNAFPLYLVRLIDDVAQVRPIGEIEPLVSSGLRFHPFRVLGLSRDGRALVIDPQVPLRANSDTTNQLNFYDGETTPQRHLILVLDTQTEQIDILPIGAGNQLIWRDDDTFIQIGDEGVFQHDIDTQTTTQIATPDEIPANFVLSPDGRYAAGARQPLTEPGFLLCRTGV